MMVTLSKPIYHHNTFRGALAIDITLDELEEIVQLGTSTDSEYFLINQYGEIVATNKIDVKGGVVPITSYLDTLGIDESEFSVLRTILSTSSMTILSKNEHSAIRLAVNCYK